MPVHEHILSIHQKRAQDSLDRLLQAYLAGDITHESDLLRRLTDEYAELYSNLKDPLTTPISMRVDGFLRLSAIQKPFTQLDSDLETSYEQIERLRAAVLETSNICAVEREGLQDLLSQAKDRIIEARAWVSDSDPSFKWSSDTFKTTSKVNVDTSTAWIDTRLGVATLAVTGEAPLADRVSRIAIRHVGPSTKEVDGLPGNWLELGPNTNGDVLSEIKEPVSVTYANQTYKPSYNPTAMFDGDPSTWFEWEKYLVPKSQRLSLKGDSAYVVATGTTGQLLQLFGPTGVTADYGWEYSVHWPATTSTDDAAHLVVTPVDWDGSGDAPIEEAIHFFIEIEFDSQQELSWIEILPYLPGAEFALTSAQASPDGVSDWTELRPKDRDGNMIPLVLNPEVDQRIESALDGIPVKDHKGTGIVPCRIPRTKILRLEFVQQKPYQTMIAHKYYLKTTVTQKSKSSWFGLKHSSSTNVQKLRIPTPTLNPSFSGGGSFLGWGSKTTVTDTDIDTFYDIFRANRYCIGIRDLGLLKRSYAKSSRIVSRAHRFDRNITAASIIASENIPEDWDTSQRWITYEISHDGTNWQTVTPQNTEGTAQGVVHFPATKELYVRATLTRPDDRPTESPVLEYYAVKAIPEESA